MAWPFGGWRRQADALVSEAAQEAAETSRQEASQKEIRRAYSAGYATGARSHYNAAKKGRRTARWGESAAGANAVSAADGLTLRERARHQVRNSPHAAKARMLFVSSVVGDGVRPQIKTGNPELDTKTERLFEAWSKECDADGRHDFYGLQRLVANTIPSDGECLVRRRPRRSADGLTVPLQLQVMEADHLDTSKSDIVRGKEGQATGRVIQGVELDGVSRRVAYWLYPFHPHEAISPTIGWSDSKRVPASEVAHIYHCERPGQVRGIPWLAPVMMLLEDLEAYVDAEVLRKRIEAMIVAVYKTDSGSDTKLFDAVDDGAPIVDADGTPLGDITAGEFMCIPKDDDLDVRMPTVVSGIEEFVRVVLRMIATGMGMTYELLAGDLSKVNFSSIRAGNIEWRRLARALRQVLIVRQFCEPTFRWWLAQAIAAGKLPVADYQVEWVSPHFEEVDREKDLKADVLGLASGGYTFTETLKRRGKDFDQHLEELATERQKLVEKGLALDWLSTLKAAQPAEGSKPNEDDGERARLLNI